MAHQILQERHGHYGLRTLPSLTDLEGVEVWSEHEHPGVEAVWPASVGSSGELFLVKELIRVLDDESVGVQEHALVVLRQCPAVNLKCGILVLLKYTILPG